MFCQSSFAQKQYPPITLSVPVEQEEFSNWDWIASSKMVIDYFYYTSPSQCIMTNNNYGSHNCCLSNCNYKPHNTEQIITLLAYYRLYTNLNTGRPEVLDIYSHLENFEPIIAIIKTNNDPFHTVVIRGISVFSVIVNTNIGPMTVWNANLIINDPVKNKSETLLYSSLSWVATISTVE